MQKQGRRLGTFGRVRLVIDHGRGPKEGNMTTNSGYFGFESVVVAVLAVLAVVMLSALTHAAMNTVVLV